MPLRPSLAAVVLAAASLATSGCAADPSGEADDDTVAAADDALRAPNPNGFAFAQSREERVKAVPVTDKGNVKRVVYAVKLESLGPDERIAVRGEVQLTRCHRTDVEKKTPCDSALPDNADLKFEAQIVIGNDQNDANGDRLTPVREETCTHFKHHCALAIDEAVTRGQSGTKWVKLVVAAKGDGKVMIVDEGHGGLAVTRIGKNANGNGRTITAKRESSGWYGLDASDLREANGLPGRRSRITFQTRIDDAMPGDILDVDARIHAVTDSGGSKPGGCSGAREPLITHQVFLSKDRDAEKTKIGIVTAKNGTNCKLDDDCVLGKSGATQVPKSWKAGEPVYVSVVSMGGRSCAGSGDRWRVDDDSKMTLRIRR